MYKFYSTRLISKSLERVCCAHFRNIKQAEQLDQSFKAGQPVQLAHEFAAVARVKAVGSS